MLKVFLRILVITLAVGAAWQTVQNVAAAKDGTKETKQGSSSGAEPGV